nr:MAG TPA: hypothetical protein [Caudoviricetes sp.]
MCTSPNKTPVLSLHGTGVVPGRPRRCTSIPGPERKY